MKGRLKGCSWKLLDVRVFQDSINYLIFRYFCHWKSIHWHCASGHSRNHYQKKRFPMLISFLKCYWYISKSVLDIFGLTISSDIDSASWILLPDARTNLLWRINYDYFPKKTHLSLWDRNISKTSSPLAESGSEFGGRH